MASMDELEQRIQYLEDIEAIRDLKTLYGQVCDQGYDPDKLAAMFTEDAEFHLTEKGTTQSSKGREAIRERFLLMPKRIEFAAHYFIQQSKIVVEGNSATVNWLMWTPQTLDVLFRAPYGKGWGDVKLAPPPR